jgi:hypothetical protein
MAGVVTMPTLTNAEREALATPFLTDNQREVITGEVVDFEAKRRRRRTWAAYATLGDETLSGLVRIMGYDRAFGAVRTVESETDAARRFVEARVGILRQLREHAETELHRVESLEPGSEAWRRALDKAAAAPALELVEGVCRRALSLEWPSAAELRAGLAAIGRALIEPFVGDIECSPR